MSVNTYFDKIFCINLDRRKDRWSECVNEFAKWDIGPVERFSAYPGIGHAGCTHSHRRLLQKIAEGSWKRVLILEDDFHVLTLKDLIDSKFTTDSKVVQTFIDGGPGSFNARFDRMVEMVPDDWDLLYLGGGYREKPQYRVSKHVIRTNGVLTTSSYAVTKKSAAELFEEANVYGGPIEERRPYPIDQLYSEASSKFKCYIFQPRLMIQRSGHSDISGEDSYYLMSMTDPVHENMV